MAAVVFIFFCRVMVFLIYVATARTEERRAGRKGNRDAGVGFLGGGDGGGGCTDGGGACG